MGVPKVLLRMHVSLDHTRLTAYKPDYDLLQEKRGSEGKTTYRTKSKNSSYFATV